MDFLSSMNSQTESQMENSQFSGIFHVGEGTQEDFSLPGIESQVQQDKVLGGNPNFTLETIREEETPFKRPIPPQEPQKQLGINPKEYRIQQLSQQIDILDNETQKMSQHQEINSFNQVQQNQNVVVNNNSGREEQEAINKINNGHLSAMSEQFNSKIDEMLFKSEKIMDNCKEEFCNYIEEHKQKFRKNTEFLKKLLIAETEYIISEEEKNKIIDSRMETLFNEMINILNYHQNMTK